MNTHRKLQIVFYFALMHVLVQAQVLSVSAQRPIQVECGAEIESVFSNDLQIHSYQIHVEAGTALVIYAESLAGNYQNLFLDIELSTPRGNVISAWELGERYGYAMVAGSYSHYVGKTREVRTDFLSETGNYAIRLISYTDTGSRYRLYVSCVQSSGAVISASNMVQTAQCGSIVENTFERDLEIHRYYLALQSGDAVALLAESGTANYQNLLLDVSLTTPRGNVISDWELGVRYGYQMISSSYSHYVGEDKSIETQGLPETGIYRIEVIGYTDTGAGYVFQVGCTLRDGTVIHPGDAPPTNVLASAQNGSAPAAPAFSGNGFPGLAPVDFSGVARIPMIAEVPMTGAVTPSGSEILGYTMRAEAGDVVDLSFTRLSGNLNLGLVVLSAQNQVVFQASLVTSDSLTTRFTVPANGQYTVGVFRMDLLPPASPEATAFQVMATINP